jgi:asparagine synthase (glutamine-hydrolysing)
MCGIAGIIAWTPQQGKQLRAEVDRMQQIQWQRGPDAGGTSMLDMLGAWSDALDADTSYRLDASRYRLDNVAFDLTDTRVALGHRRLSIQDVSEKAHQPMVDASGRYRLIFNGEVFNFTELRRDLESRGQAFSSRSDTEVLLYGLIHHGADFLASLNGFYAGCFVDALTGDCLLFRDRPGVKPLFLLNQSGRIAFASSTNALRSLLPGCTIRREQLAAYLVYGQTFTEHGKTWFEEITELLPGNYLIINTKSGEQRHGVIPPFPAGEATLETKLQTSLTQRLVADVPLGFAASGGLDSSLFLGMASALQPEQTAKRLAFSSVSNDVKTDETPWQEMMARHTGVQRIACAVQSQDASALESLMQAADMPPAGWNNLAHFQLCHTARAHGVKVMLNGQGADELFAGYKAYLSYWWQELDLVKRLNAIKIFHNSGLDLKEVLKLLIRHAWQRRISPKRWQELALKRKPFAAILGADVFANLPEPSAMPSNLSAALQADFYGQKLGQMLQWEDRNSMAAGLESRNPFADDAALAALAWAMPSGNKIHDGWSKYPLRKIGTKYLPEAITWRRDKKGFTVADRQFTLNAWPVLTQWLASVPETWAVQSELQAIVYSPEKYDDAQLAFVFRLAAAARFVQLTQSVWP